MPIHDYECGTCYTLVLDHYLPRQDSATPRCENCPDNPPLLRLWSTNRQHRIFQAFNFTMDDGKVVTVDSLHALRKIEKETGDAYARGELKRPFVFRHYTQDPSNKDKNVFEHLRREQVDPRTIRTQAGALMESGFVSSEYQHKVHHATARALADQTHRSRSRSR